MGLLSMFLLKSYLLLFVVLAGYYLVIFDILEQLLNIFLNIHAFVTAFVEGRLVGGEEVATTLRQPGHPGIAVSTAAVHRAGCADVEEGSAVVATEVVVQEVEGALLIRMLLKIKIGLLGCQSTEEEECEEDN